MELIESAVHRANITLQIKNVVGRDADRYRFAIKSTVFCTLFCLSTLVKPKKQGTCFE